MFGRKAPEHTVVCTFEGGVHDDFLHIVSCSRSGCPCAVDSLANPFRQNTQSGTQWDGMKHFGILEHQTFYQGTPASEFKHGDLGITSPTDVDPELIKLGIHSTLRSLASPLPRLLTNVTHPTRLG